MVENEINLNCAVELAVSVVIPVEEDDAVDSVISVETFDDAGEDVERSIDLLPRP
jgi:hypothetical protein